MDNLFVGDAPALAKSGATCSCISIHAFRSACISVGIINLLCFSMVFKYELATIASYSLASSCDI